MKVIRVSVDELNRGMVFELFEKKYIVCDVVRNRRSSRKYSEPEERVTRAYEMEVSFFEVDNDNNPPLQYLTVASNFEFMIHQKDI